MLPARPVAARAREEGLSVKRSLIGAAAIMLAVALFAGAAAARGPGGRTFHGAVFSAGVSGDSKATAGPAIAFAPPVDSLVRVARGAGIPWPLAAQARATSGSVTLDSQ